MISIMEMMISIMEKMKMKFLRRNLRGSIIAPLSAQRVPDGLLPVMTLFVTIFIIIFIIYFFVLIFIINFFVILPMMTLFSTNFIIDKPSQLVCEIYRQQIEYRRNRRNIYRIWTEHRRNTDGIQTEYRRNIDGI